MFTWTKELELGNPAIDSQHKQWINSLNQLLEACSQGKGRDSIRGTLIFLQDYTAKHFNDEEALQRNSKYPEYATHKQYHEAFKKTVQEIVGEYDKSGPTIALTGKINSALGSWFINHIRREDSKLAAYLRKAQ